MQMETVIHSVGRRGRCLGTDNANERLQWGYTYRCHERPAFNDKLKRMDYADFAIKQKARQPASATTALGKFIVSVEHCKQPKSLTLRVGRVASEEVVLQY